jgi:hypothetical protein
MTVNKNVTSARHMKDSELFTTMKGKKYFTFTKDAKQIARKMSQQYSAKKKAFETANSSFAKTGSLDISRISSFKTSDSIFKTKMMQKEGQSHGLVLVIDWSGSMSGTIKYVACQVLITMLYAKYSGIPFEVYTFTSGSSGYGKSQKTLKTYGSNFSFYRIADNSFKEKDLINLFGHMIAYDEKHNIKMSDYYNQYVREKLGSMGGTPLVQAQIASYISGYDLREKLKLDIAISITGIAGPGGGSEEKPVGTVCLGLSDKSGISTQRLVLFGDREQLKNRFSQAALMLLLEKLQSY